MRYTEIETLWMKIKQTKFTLLLARYANVIISSFVESFFQESVTCYCYTFVCDISLCTV